MRICSDASDEGNRNSFSPLPGLEKKCIGHQFYCETLQELAIRFNKIRGNLTYSKSETRIRFDLRILFRRLSSPQAATIHVFYLHYNKMLIPIQVFYSSCFSILVFPRAEVPQALKQKKNVPRKICSFFQGGSLLADLLIVKHEYPFFPSKWPRIKIIQRIPSTKNAYIVPF